MIRLSQCWIGLNFFFLSFNLTLYFSSTSLFLLVLGFTERQPDHYRVDDDNDYVYPDTVQALAYLVELSPVALVLIIFIFMLFKKWREDDIGSLFSSDQWRPRDDCSDKSGVENENFER